MVNEVALPRSQHAVRTVYDQNDPLTSYTTISLRGHAIALDHTNNTFTTLRALHLLPPLTRLPHSPHTIKRPHRLPPQLSLSDQETS